MPYFLQLFAQTLVKTLRHCSLHKKVASFGEIDKFWWFFAKCHTFLHHFSLNLVKTLKRCSLDKRTSQFWRHRHILVVFHKMPFFLQLFAKNLVKTLRHCSLHKKVASFCEIDTFWWFFTKCHSFCNFLLKIWSKP